MTQLKTKGGSVLFNATVEAVGVELHKKGDNVVAVVHGKVIGTVKADAVHTFVRPDTKGKTMKVKVEDLQVNIDPSTLIGKDPTTLTQEELIVLTTYLQSLAGAQAAATTDVEDEEEDEVEAKPKAKGKAKASKPAPVEEDDEEDEEEDEDEDAFELPEGLDTYEAIAALGVKDMWAKIGKHVAAEAGIKARTPKDEMLDAIAEYFDLEPAEDEEEEEVKPKAKGKGKAKPAPVVEDDEDDEEDEEDDEEFDDEDDSDDIDDEDDEDDDDSDDIDDEEDDDDEYDDEEEDDDEDDEDGVTEEDVEALFKKNDKTAIVKFCKEHGIVLPQKKMSAALIKQIIMDELFGEDDE